MLFRSVLRADLLAYVGRERLDFSAWRAVFVTAYKHPALLAVVSFRLGKLCQRLPAPVRQVALTLYYLLVYPPVRLLTGVELPLSCELGPGLTVWHFGGTIFGGGVVAGKNLCVNQGVLLARKHRDSEVVTLGDDVTLGARCVVLCALIGDGATVGAGAVVTRDVPPGVTVIGNPARPLPFCTHPPAPSIGLSPASQGRGKGRRRCAPLPSRRGTRKHAEGRGWGRDAEVGELGMGAA